MNIKRKIRSKLRKTLGIPNPDPGLRISLISRTMLRFTSHLLGLNVTQTGDLFLKLGLASYRSREQGDMRQLIEELIGSDYLKRFRELGVNGVVTRSGAGKAR